MIRWATSAELVAGLRHDRHAGEQRARRLLGEAPGGEVERVDVHGHAAARHGARAGRGSAGCARAGCPRRPPAPRVAQRLAEVGVGRQGEGRAVHVELGVAARVAAVGDGQVEQLVAVGDERVAHRLQQRAALREGQRAQRRAAHRARVLRAPRPGRRRPRPRGRAAPRWPGSRSVSSAPVPSTQRPPTWLRAGRRSSRDPELAQDERVVERDLAQEVVAAGGAAVARGHVGLEEQRVARRS